MERLFGYDPAARKWSKVFTQDDLYVVETTYDVEPIIEQNRAEYNAHSHKAVQRWKGDGFHKVGSIPMHIYFQLHRSGLLYDEEALTRWFLDPENSKWLTHPLRR